MAFLAERAGAIATDGSGSILDIEPDSLHQRVPLIFGSAVELRRLMELHRH
jgi:fructose-1,6-bisphosphatase